MSGLRIEGAPAPPGTPTADAELVAGLVRHDPAAVAEVYDRYAERLLGFCTGMLRDHHEAADALHDTILVAAERIGQLRDPERLRPWLYAIARTQCLARLRKRERTALSEDPTELAGGRAMSADTTPEGDGARAAEGGEAAELVWAAAEGLDEGDRVLLELHLRQGLDGSELAAAAGVKPGQISMVTGRMRERLERALGALLVARHGRRDCDELDGILRDWDGRLTVLMRKRVARHVDRCAVCDDRRSGLVAPLGSLAVGAPAVLATTDLKAAVVAGAERIWGGTAAPDVTEAARWDADGFPPDPPHRLAERPEHGDLSPLVRRRAAIAAAAAVLILLGGVVAWWSTASTAEDEVRADRGTTQVDDDPDAGGTPRSGDPDPTTTAPASSTSTTTGPAPTTAATTPVQPGPTSTTTPPLDGGGSGGPAAGPTVPDGGPGVGSGTAPPATPAPPAPPPPNPAPTIGGTSLSRTSLQTTCNPANATAMASASVSDTGGSLTVTLRFVAPDGTSGQRPMLGGGTRTATLGPFATVGTATWWVVASDGTHTVESAHRTVAVDPCPG
jgi:RNA polymerase sigma factor (sigma-70 family)